MLLEQIIKYTWQSHPDYDNLQYALQRMKDSAKQIDRAKCFNENRHLIKQFQKYIGPRRSSMPALSSLSSRSMQSEEDLMDLESRFIAQGMVCHREVNGMFYRAFVNSRDDTAVRQKERITAEEKGDVMNAFLFADMLVLLKVQKENKLMNTLARTNTLLNGPIGGSNKFCTIIPLEQAKIDPCLCTFQRKDTLHSFFISSSDHNRHFITVDTAASKSKWLADLEEAIDLQQNLSPYSVSPDVSDLLTLGSASEPRHLDSVSEIMGSSEQTRSSTPHLFMSALKRKGTKMFKSNDAVDTILKTMKLSGNQLKKQGLVLARRVSQYSARSLPPMPNSSSKGLH
jgi:hypothetical protein